MVRSAVGRRFLLEAGVVKETESAGAAVTSSSYPDHIYAKHEPGEEWSEHDVKEEGFWCCKCSCCSGAMESSVCCSSGKEVEAEIERASSPALTCSLKAATELPSTVECVIPVGLV